MLITITPCVCKRARVRQNRSRSKQRRAPSSQDSQGKARHRPNSWPRLHTIILTIYKYIKLFKRSPGVPTKPRRWAGKWREFHSRVSDLGSLQVEGLCVLTEQHHVLLQVPHVPVFMVSHTFLLKDKNRTAALSDAYIHTGRTTLNYIDIKLHRLPFLSNPSWHEAPRTVNLPDYSSNREKSWLLNTKNCWN